MTNTIIPPAIAADRIGLGDSAARALLDAGTVTLVEVPADIASLAVDRQQATVYVSSAATPDDARRMGDELNLPQAILEAAGAES
jgi:hypothetical protein